jgi:hypothetical protein
LACWCRLRHRDGAAPLRAAARWRLLLLPAHWACAALSGLGQALVLPGSLDFVVAVSCSWLTCFIVCSVSRYLRWCFGRVLTFALWVVICLRLVGGFLGTAFCCLLRLDSFFCWKFAVGVCWWLEWHCFSGGSFARPCVLLAACPSLVVTPHTQQNAQSRYGVSAPGNTSLTPWRATAHRSGTPCKPHGGLLVACVHITPLCFWATPKAVIAPGLHWQQQVHRSSLYLPNH